MARFKLVKIGRRRVEVQKVRLKLNFGILLIAFACAFLVWLYVKGSAAQMLPPGEGPRPGETTSAQREVAPETVSNGTWRSMVAFTEDGGRSGVV